jgi:hypothetical protein
MGLIAQVYRPAGFPDCTNNGWSARFDRVCIVNAEGPFEPSEDCPGVIVQKHRTMKSIHAVSVADAESGKWTMFGGNVLSMSDSRLGELVAELLGKDFQYAWGAIKIHDRIE